MEFILLYYTRYSLNVFTKERIPKITDLISLTQIYFFFQYKNYCINLFSSISAMSCKFLSLLSQKNGTFRYLLHEERELRRFALSPPSLKVAFILVRIKVAIPLEKRRSRFNALRFDVFLGHPGQDQWRTQTQSSKYSCVCVYTCICVCVYRYIDAR